MTTARRIRRLGLELSLKPFASFAPVDVTATCEEVFRQWSLLSSCADELAVLLWIADGSEILEWNAELDRPLEWGSLVGFANTEWDPYGQHNISGGRIGKPYRDDVPPLSYRTIRLIVSTLKEVGERKFGVPVTVGATFDPGPEFARSEFKYVRHRELLVDGEELGLGRLISMLRVDSALKADAQPYAAFPGGIPDQLPFGTYLGAQAQSYCDAMGFDYLWLSNGFGFSSFPWAPVGVGFDGTQFHPERLEESRAAMSGFWQDLLRASDLPIEVRGTNFTAGMDIGTDGTPASEIMAQDRVRNPPPNSPWGPLNQDFAIELTGYMSRISRLPGDGFLFRFYANDPWFWQNPWWDFYCRDPFDIYIPLSVGRLDDSGKTVAASDVQILSIDTAGGVLDERVGREVGGRILEALESAPDEAGPLVWLYPFAQYHDDAVEDASTGASTYFEDNLITAAVAEGLPLNTVLDRDDLAGALAAGALDGRVVIAPTRALSGGLARALRAGGVDVVAYGAVDRCDSLLSDDLGLSLGKALSGELEVTGTLTRERSLSHPAELSGGGIREFWRGDVGSELASVVGAHGSRAYAVAATPHPETAARLLWIRGSASTLSYKVDEHGLRSSDLIDRTVHTSPAELLLTLLEQLGFILRTEKAVESQPSIVHTVHRANGAWWFDGYLADSTVRARWRFPFGAPLLHQRDCEIVDGVATYAFERSYHRECRLFARQKSGRVSVRELAPFPFGTERYFEARGLCDAEVTVFPPRKSLHSVELTVDDERVNGRIDEFAGTQTVSVTGTLRVRW